MNEDRDFFAGVFSGFLLSAIMTGNVVLFAVAMGVLAYYFMSD